MEEATMTATRGSFALAVVLILAGLVWSAKAQQPLIGAGPAMGLSSRELVTHFQPSDGKPTTLTIIDPQTRAIGVYHISRDTGEIQLKSIRNFSSDLQVEEFNSGSPLPKDIREGLRRVQ
jgi:hypothetical protein